MIRNLLLSLCTATVLGSLVPAQSIDSRAFDEIYNRISKRSSRQRLSRETRRELKWVLQQLAQLKRRKRGFSARAKEDAYRVEQARNELAESIDKTEARIHTLERKLKGMLERLTPAHPSIIETRKELRVLVKEGSQLRRKLTALEKHKAKKDRERELASRQNGLEHSLASAESGLRSKRESLRKLSQELSKRHPKVAHAQAVVADLQQRVNQLRAELSEIRSHQASRRRRIDPALSENEEPFIVEEEVLEEEVIEEEPEEEEEVIEEPLLEDVTVIDRNEAMAKKERSRDLTERKMRLRQLEADRTRELLKADYERALAAATAVAEERKVLERELKRERSRLDQQRGKSERTKNRRLEQAMAQLDQARAHLNAAKSKQERAKVEQEIADLKAQLEYRKADLDQHRSSIEQRMKHLKELQDQLTHRSVLTDEMAQRQHLLRERLESLKGLENRGARKAIYEQAQELERQALRGARDQLKRKEREHRKSRRNSNPGTGAHRHRDLESQLNELRNEMQEFKNMLKQLRKRDTRLRSLKLH